jgi:hypothetical protein
MAFSKIDKQDVEAILKRLTGNKPCSITIAAGAANVATFTIQFAESGRRVFDLYMSTDAEGDNVSGTTYSTGLAATTGVVLASFTASKHLRVITDATGKAVLTLTATAKPEGEYMCVIPAGGTPVLSAATVTASYGA